MLRNVSCLKLNVSSSTKSTFYTINSLNCWWIYCDPTNYPIFSILVTAMKTGVMFAGKGSLAVGYACVVALK